MDVVVHNKSLRWIVAFVALLNMVILELNLQ
jgi:hypothetical protein